MKILCAGVQHLKGTSKAGNQFDMCQLISLGPIENRSTPKMSVRGHGFQPMNINLDDSIVDQFKDVKFPAVLDVTCEPRPTMGQMQTTIVALHKAV